MKNIEYKKCNSRKELTGILSLQNKNHYAVLPKEEIAAEGFLTCTHNLDLLLEWNNIAPHIIAVSKGEVVAYLLTMTKDAEYRMPFLEPMFNAFKNNTYKNRKISEYNYLIVGQVCVAKELRGLGVLKKCYDLYKREYSNKYDFAITEIATRNQRSLKAHYNLGFQEIHRYKSTEGEEWSIVIWEWKN